MIAVVLATLLHRNRMIMVSHCRNRDENDDDDDSGFGDESCRI